MQSLSQVCFQRLIVLLHKAEIRNGAEKLLVNGNKLSEDMLISDEPEDALHAAPYIRIYSDKELSALYKYNSETGCYKCFKYLQ